MPIVESGSALSQATVPAPVASVLHNVTGEANFIKVSPSSQPALPTFHSVNVPIDAIKLKLKFGLTNLLILVFYLAPGQVIPGIICL